MATKALEGVTVVAASLAEAGPVTSQMLGFLGAEVYHVERPIDKPTARYTGSIIRNSNKKTITLNCKLPEGREIMWRLLEKADVFMENFAPDAWANMGFSYEEVKKRNPEIIYVSIKGFQKKSRWGDCITYDPVAMAYSGAASLCGYEDMDPMMCGINVADSGAAAHTAMTIMMAILKKKLTGKGQYIEASMQDAVMVECRGAFAEYYERGGKNPRRAGNSYKGLKPTAPYNVYPTLGTDPVGNHIAITCSDDENSTDFQRLCEAMGRPDLLEDPRYATPALRYENRHSLDAEISKWTYRHEKNEAMDILAGKYGIAAGAVWSPRDMCSNEFMCSTILQDMPDPRIGSLQMPIIPTDMSAHRIVAETCGEHGDGNEAVYCGVLGMSKEELESLREKHVI